MMVWNNGCALLDPVKVGWGDAPMPYVNGMAKVAHLGDPVCSFGYPGNVPVSAGDRSHSTRGICGCMSGFEADREVAAEFLSRDRVLDGFWNCLTMIRIYGIDRVMDDSILYQIIAKYQHLSSNYAIQRSCRQPGWADYHDASYPLLVPESFDSSDIIQTCMNHDRNLWVQFLQKWHSQAEKLPFSGMKKFDFSKVPWTVAVNKPNDISVVFKIMPDNSRLALLRLEIILHDLTLDALLTIISEVEMTTSWCPYITFPFKVGLREARVIRRQGRLDQSSLYRVDLPWPFNNREALLQGWLVDDLDRHGLTVLAFRAVDPDYPMPPCMEPVGNLANGLRKAAPIFVDGTCCLRQLDDRTIWLGVCWNLDLKLSIPSSLLSFVSKSFVKMGIESLAKAARAAENDPSWLKRKKANPWLYEYIRFRLDQWRTSEITALSRAQFKQKITSPVSIASTETSSPLDKPRRRWKHGGRWFSRSGSNAEGSQYTA